MSSLFDTAKFDGAKFETTRPMDAARTLALYQDYYATNGPALPAGQPSDMRFVDHLSASLDGLQGLILDSYGVIGLGSAPIDGITGLFSAAAQKDIPVIILTNGASQPAERRVKGYRDWGLPISAADIVSSRDATYQMVRQIMADRPDARFSYLGHNVISFDDVPGLLYSDNHPSWDEADYFIFLGATGWGEADQQRLHAALNKKGASVIIGNPDVSAPVDGRFTFEPGFWGMKAQRHTNAPLLMAGKPFATAYEIAFAALEKKAGRSLDKACVGMVGDSLHTDILGAKSFGLQAILLSSYGLLAGRDIASETERAAIYPDMVARYL